jgi:flagellar hook-length control protein FliK
VVFEVLRLLSCLDYDIKKLNGVSSNMPGTIIGANGPNLPIELARRVPDGLENAAKLHDDRNSCQTDTILADDVPEIDAESIPAAKNNSKESEQTQKEDFKALLNHKINKTDHPGSEAANQEMSVNPDSLESTCVVVSELSELKAGALNVSAESGDDAGNVINLQPQNTAKELSVQNDQPVLGVIEPDEHAADKAKTTTSELNTVLLKDQSPKEGQKADETDLIPLDRGNQTQNSLIPEVSADKEQQKDIDGKQNKGIVQQDLKSDVQIKVKETIKHPAKSDSSENLSPELSGQHGSSTLEEESNQEFSPSDESSKPQASPLFSSQNDSPKGFQIRNVESAEHAVGPGEHASVSAVQAPSRTGVHHADIQDIKPIDQIFQHVSSMTVSQLQQRISLTLTPQHLGTVRVTFQQEGDELIGVLEVQKAQTRREIEDTLPQLISSMQNNGIQVRRVEVVQWDSDQQGFEDNQAGGFDDVSADQDYFQHSSQDTSDADVLPEDSFRREGPEISTGPKQSSDYFINSVNAVDKELNLLI